MMGLWASLYSAADAASSPRPAPSSLPEPFLKRPEMHRRDSCGLTVPAVTHTAPAQDAAETVVLVPAEDAQKAER
jgi:hypothetical protein